MRKDHSFFFLLFFFLLWANSPLATGPHSLSLSPSPFPFLFPPLSLSLSLLSSAHPSFLLILVMYKLNKRHKFLGGDTSSYSISQCNNPHNYEDTVDKNITYITNTVSGPPSFHSPCACLVPKEVREREGRQ